MQVLNETLRAQEDPFDGLAMTKKMWGRVFQGIGTEIVVNPAGDRVFDFYVLAFDRETFQFVVKNYSACMNCSCDLKCEN